jgi:hypothetical protein
MTRTTIRQVLVPDGDMDVESYRSCFTDSPEFAIGLINTTKQGTGGILLSNQTEGVVYQCHHHEGGSRCSDLGGKSLLLPLMLTMSAESLSMS